MAIPENVAARPGRFGSRGSGGGGGIDYELPSQNVPVPPGNPMSGMTATFPGGPIAPGMGGPVGIPDPIPGVDKSKVNSILRWSCTENVLAPSSWICEYWK